jgi:hypothetical protein
VRTFSRTGGSFTKRGLISSFVVSSIHLRASCTIESDGSWPSAMARRAGVVNALVKTGMS